MATIQDIFDWLNQGAQGDIPGTGGAGADSPSGSSNPYAGSTVPGTRDNPQVQPGEGGAVVGSRPVPGSADRNSFWNFNEIAPYNPPGQADDRVEEAAARQGQTGYQAGQKAGQGIAQMLVGKPQQTAQKPSTITVDPDTTANLDFRGIGNLLSQYHQIAQTAPGTDQYFDPQNPQSSVVTPSNYAGDIPAELLPHFQALVKGGLPPDVAKSILLQPSTGEGETPPSDQWSSYSGWQQEAQAAQQGDRTAALWNQMKDKIFNDALNLPTWESSTPGDDDSLGFTRLPSGQYVPGWGG